MNITTEKHIAGKSIYLDWNVYVRLMASDYPDLFSLLNKAKPAGTVIPFSAIHINEAANIRSKEEILTRLGFINELSNQIYFESSITNIGLIKKAPLCVYKTTKNTSSAEETMKILGNMVSRSMLMAIRKLLGLDPRQLNNIAPEEIWGELDRTILSSRFSSKLPAQFRESPILHLAHLAQQGSNKSFKDISHSFHRMSYLPDRQDTMVSILYSLLESFGYFPEKSALLKEQADSMMPCTVSMPYTQQYAYRKTLDSG